MIANDKKERGLGQTGQEADGVNLVNRIGPCDRVANVDSDVFVEEPVGLLSHIWRLGTNAHVPGGCGGQSWRGDQRDPDKRADRQPAEQSLQTM